MVINKLILSKCMYVWYGSTLQRSHRHKMPVLWRRKVPTGEVLPDWARSNCSHRHYYVSLGYCTLESELHLSLSKYKQDLFPRPRGQ